MSAEDSLVPASTHPRPPAPCESPDDPQPGELTTAPADRRGRLARLGDRIAELSARIQAATCELLVLIRKFDERQGWDGCLSCAEWLSWRAGLSPGAAREHVRVARALGRLPKLSDAMRRGRISYSKVRAVTRVATPENEDDLLYVCNAGTAAHVERIARAWRRIDRNVEQAEERRRNASRELRMITGELKSKVDRIWDTMWSGGISNPLSVIKQLTYLLFIKRLDELHTRDEHKAARTGRPHRPPDREAAVHPPPERAPLVAFQGAGAGADVRDGARPGVPLHQGAASDRRLRHGIDLRPRVSRRRRAASAGARPRSPRGPTSISSSGPTELALRRS